MNLLMLSGNSQHNQNFVYEAQAKLGHLFENTIIQDYEHWKTDADWIDLRHELTELKAKELKGSYGVFAKSIGTVLTLQAIQQGIITPQFLLLLGLPLNYIKKEAPNIKDLLLEANLPTIIIHNSHDFVGSSEALRAYLGNIPQKMSYCTLIENQADNHDYEDYAQLKECLQTLQKKAT